MGRNRLSGLLTVIEVVEVLDNKSRFAARSAMARQTKPKRSSPACLNEARRPLMSATSLRFYALWKKEVELPLSTGLV